MQICKVVQVALAVPLHRVFDYLPENNITADTYSTGQRVLAPFGARKLVGVVVGASDNSRLPQAKLKQIIKRLDDAAVISAETIELCRWTSTYYQAPIGEVISSAMPPALRTGRPFKIVEKSVTEVYWRSSKKDNKDSALRGTRQQALLFLLNNSESGQSETNLKQHGFTKNQINKLHDKGYIEPFNPEPRQKSTEPEFNLSADQEKARSQLSAAIGRFSIFLLEGITGSGKTEVYLEWIDKILSSGKQALVLAPEISLTPQLIRRFEKRFCNSVSGYHSGLSDKERFKTWHQASCGKSRIVIGTRSAVFIPFAELGGIVVDEEHDGSFKQQDNIRYNARDLAVIKARNANCPVALGSATPSLETLFNVRSKRYQHLILEERAKGAILPKVEIIDIKSRPLEAGLSQPLLKKIDTHLSEDGQVLIFINRRGFAPVLMCSDCGWSAECRHCDARLTVHRQPAHLRCHHCEVKRPIPSICPNCESMRINPIGSGTERTEDYLERFFPQIPIIRIDRDTVKNIQELDKSLAKIRSGKPCIIIGTQMLSKGHDFPNLSLVGILNADSGLFSSDFRGAEKTAQLLIQVAGRAGRADKPGLVVMQSHYPDHPLVQALSKHNYRQIADDELKLRQSAGLPPIFPMVALRGEGSGIESALNGLAAIRHNMEENLPETLKQHIAIHGPFPCTMQRKQNRYHTILWITAPKRAPLHNFLREWLAKIENKAPVLPRGFRWLTDVDPMEVS